MSLVSSPTPAALPSRPAPTAQADITVGPAVSSSTAHSYPGATLDLTASVHGGGGAYTFSYETDGNSSGGHLTAAGAYTAGATGQVMDFVHVVDAYGNA